MSIATRTRRSADQKVPKTRRDAARTQPGTNAASGLCVNCNHCATCGYRRDPGRPVLFCEEFECLTPPAAENAPATVVAPTEKDMADWDKYKGLCVNCDNRETCQIRNAEIGVWHCEEYQ